MLSYSMDSGKSSSLPARKGLIYRGRLDPRPPNFMDALKGAGSNGKVAVTYFEWGLGPFGPQDSIRAVGGLNRTGPGRGRKRDRARASYPPWPFAPRSISRRAAAQFCQKPLFRLPAANKTAFAAVIDVSGDGGEQQRFPFHRRKVRERDRGSIWPGHHDQRAFPQSMVKNAPKLYSRPRKHRESRHLFTKGTGVIGGAREAFNHFLSRIAISFKESDPHQAGAARNRRSLRPGAARFCSGGRRRKPRISWHDRAETDVAGRPVGGN